MLQKNFPRRLAVFIILLPLLEGFSYFFSTYGAGRIRFYIPLYRAHITESYDDYIARLNPALGWPSKTHSHNLDGSGSRIIPAFPDPNVNTPLVSTYGWVGEVSNEDNWSNVLAVLLNRRVSDYTIGGYGSDQAYLRFHQNDSDRAKIVIMAYYSENIIRNVNQLRNLIAPSDQCGLKPVFTLKNSNELQLVPIPELSKEQYAKLGKEPELFLAHDFFKPGGSSDIR